MVPMSFIYSSTLPLNPDLESGKLPDPQLTKSSSSTIQILIFLFLLAFGISVFVVPSMLKPANFKKTTYADNYVKDGGSYPLPGLKNLVMVAGHSIYNSTTCGDFEDNGSWTMLPYQVNVSGQAASFVKHIEVGVEETAKDEALLLFSGGETREGAGPRSEAQSYWTVAESEGWFGKKDSVRRRAVTEENARDSFENLLFSVCRFKELTGTYPQKITVVSYNFKEKRFSELHRSAMRFPEEKFSFIGTPLPEEGMPGAITGEANTIAAFKEDPYGCKDSLHGKRLQRDPFHRTVPYPAGCPELTGLFDYCGTTTYSGTLPWGQ